MNIIIKYNSKIVSLTLLFLLVFLSLSCSKSRKFDYPDTYIAKSVFNQVREGVVIPGNVEWRKIELNSRCDKYILIQEGILSEHKSYPERKENNYVLYSDWELNHKVELVLIDSEACMQFRRVLDYSDAFRLGSYSAPSISIDDVSPDTRYVIMRTNSYPYIPLIGWKEIRIFDLDIGENYKLKWSDRDYRFK